MDPRWINELNANALDLTDLNELANGINFQWHAGLLARWSEFWVEVMCHTPEIPGRARLEYRSRMYMMMRFAALLLQTSPYGDQPATLGPGSLPARERHPPENLLFTETALSQREREAIPSIVWLMVLMRNTMYTAHARIFQNITVLPHSQLVDGIERLGIFINWLNEAAEYTGVPRLLQSDLHGNGIVLRIVDFEDHPWGHDWHGLLSSGLSSSGVSDDDGGGDGTLGAQPEP